MGGGSGDWNDGGEIGGSGDRVGDKGGESGGGGIGACCCRCGGGGIGGGKRVGFGGGFLGWSSWGAGFESLGIELEKWLLGGLSRHVGVRLVVGLFSEVAVDWVVGS